MFSNIFRKTRFALSFHQQQSYYSSTTTPSASPVNWTHLVTELDAAGKSKNFKKFNDVLLEIETELSNSVSSSSSTQNYSTNVLSLCPMNSSQVAETFSHLSHLAHLRLSWKNSNVLLWALCCTCDHFSASEAMLVMRSLRIRKDLYHASVATTLCEVVAYDLNHQNNSDTNNSNVNNASLHVSKTSVTSRAEQLCEFLMFVSVFRLHEQEHFLPFGKTKMLDDVCTELARISTSSASSSSSHNNSANHHLLLPLSLILPVQTPFFISVISLSKLPHAPLIVVLQRAMMESLTKQTNISMLYTILQYHLTHEEVKRVGLAFIPRIIKMCLEKFDGMMMKQNASEELSSAIENRDGSNNNNNSAENQNVVTLSPALFKEVIKFMSSAAALVRTLEMDEAVSKEEITELQNLLKRANFRFDDWVLGSVWEDAVLLAKQKSDSNNDKNHFHATTNQPSDDGISSIIQSYFGKTKCVKNLDDYTIFRILKNLRLMLSEEILEMNFNNHVKKLCGKNDDIIISTKSSEEILFDDDENDDNNNETCVSREESTLINKKENALSSENLPSFELIQEHQKLYTAFFLLLAISMLRLGQSSKISGENAFEQTGARQVYDRFIRLPIHKHRIVFNGKRIPPSLLDSETKNDESERDYIQHQQKFWAVLNCNSVDGLMNVCDEKGAEEENNILRRVVEVIRKLSRDHPELGIEFFVASQSKSGDQKDVASMNGSTEVESIWFRNFCELCLTPPNSHRNNNNQNSEQNDRNDNRRFNNSSFNHNRFRGRFNNHYSR